MRTLALIIPILLVTGCDISASKAHIDMAVVMCEPNGGLFRMDVTRMTDNSRTVTAYCNNGVVAQRNMDPK